MFSKKLRIFTLNMKAKPVKYFFTLLSAAYFLFAGTGYNVVNYCCQICANEGIETVATSSCNAVHHHTHSNDHNPQNGDMSCSDVNHQPTSCHLLRLSIDIPIFQTTQELSVNTINSCNLLFTSVLFLNVKPVINVQNTAYPPGGYFLSTGREIITYHAVLLI